jgi:hypothetical protein
MLKPVLQLAAVGVVGALVWKLAAFLLLPLLGTALGFVFLIVKIALVVGIVAFLFWMFNRKKSGGDVTDEAHPAP